MVAQEVNLVAVVAAAVVVAALPVVVALEIPEVRQTQQHLMALQ